MDDTLKPELKAAIEALEGKWNQYFHINEKDGPDTLYHYTSAAGLHGILSHKNLWASNVLFMNDASEVVYGRQVVARMLGPRRDKIPICGAFTGDRLFGLGESWNIYVACFCENSDLLSQWRGYGVEGGGYCMGMNRNRLNTLAGKPRQYVLFPVIYDVKRQEEIVRCTIDEAFSTVEKVEARRQGMVTVVAGSRNATVDIHFTI